MQAEQSIRAALEVVGSGVPFPGLYAPLFEAARTEFENILRRTAIDVAAAYSSEEAPERAEPLLRRLLEIIPEDEEATALLDSALRSAGRLVEAERQQMRGSIPVE